MRETARLEKLFEAGTLDPQIRHPSVYPGM